MREGERRKEIGRKKERGERGREECSNSKRKGNKIRGNFKGILQTFPQTGGSEWYPG